MVKHSFVSWMLGILLSSGVEVGAKLLLTLSKPRLQGTGFFPECSHLLSSKHPPVLAANGGVCRHVWAAKAKGAGHWALALGAVPRVRMEGLRVLGW